VPFDETERRPQAEWVGEPSFESAACVRHRLRASLTMWGLSEDVVADAVLVVGELVANVVEHAVHDSGCPLFCASGCCGCRCRTGGWACRTLTRSIRRPDGHGPAVGDLRGVPLGWQEHEAGKTVWAELVV
jgi:histidine kinase-like protein